MSRSRWIFIKPSPDLSLVMDDIDSKMWRHVDTFGYKYVFILCQCITYSVIHRQVAHRTNDIARFRQWALQWLYTASGIISLEHHGTFRTCWMLHRSLTHLVVWSMYLKQSATCSIVDAWVASSVINPKTGTLLYLRKISSLIWSPHIVITSFCIAGEVYRVTVLQMITQHRAIGLVF